MGHAHEAWLLASPARPRHPSPSPQEARFDRHFVRDLQWSRHQLEELAERRFMAAQVGAEGMYWHC